MKKTISRKKKKEFEIVLRVEDNFYEEFNHEKVSRELIQYLIENVNPFEKEQIKIVIENRLHKEECIPMIREGIKEEYEKCLHIKKYNNKVQFYYCLVGLVMLFFSFYVTHDSIFKEIFLISGWVLIWDTIEIEMFSDSDNRKRQKILRKLYYSKIVEEEGTSK